MPIRFECDQCGQRLSIARRKAGTEIACPTCGRGQCVPGEPSAELPEESGEADPAADEVETVENGQSVPEPIAEVPSDLEGEEDQPPFVFSPASAEPPPFPDEVDLSKTIDLDYPPEAARVSAAPPPPPRSLPSKADREPSGAMPRPPVPWAVYVQALLLLCVALGAFSGGYYLGRQDGSAMDAEPEEQTIALGEPDDGFANEEVLLEGRILWMPNLGQSAGDGSATFIALPQNRIPQSSLPITGLQPGGADDAGTRASVAALRAHGGVFARAESDGTLASVLPREGRYHLLMISRNTLRPRDQPIRARDLVEMKQYFAEPEALIGESKYVWMPVEMRVGAPVVEHDFGLDGL